MKYDLVTLEAVDRFGKTEMHVWGRDEQGNRKKFVDRTWRPYFFVNEHEAKLVCTPTLTVTNDHRPDLYGTPTVKLTTKLSGSVGHLRRQFDTHWQADILPELAWMLEKDIYASFEIVEDVVDGKIVKKIVASEPVYAKLRICFFDMEVDATVDRFPEAAEAKEKIVSFAAYDTLKKMWTLFVWREDVECCDVFYDNTIVRIYNSEVDCVKAIIKYLSQSFDAYIGWNSNNWDWPFLTNRCKFLGINFKKISPIGIFFFRASRDFKEQRRRDKIVCKGRIMLDGLQVYKKMTSFEAKLESYSLEYVVYHELEEIRVKQVIHDMWQRSIWETAHYPKADTDWVIKVFEKRKIIDYFSMIRRYCGCRLEDSLTNSKVLDMLCLHKAKEEGFVLPSKAPYDPYARPTGSKYKGAMVKPPIVGRHRATGVEDFTSMYPFIIIACNMSPETITDDGEIEIGNGIRFTNKFEGFIPRVIRGLVDERVIIKAKMAKLIIDSPPWELLYQHQFALKFVITSFYGVFAYEGFRLYRIEISSSTTFVGRNLMGISIATLEATKEYEVRYGDTDSMFHSLPEATWDALLKATAIVNVELKRVCIERKYMTIITMKAEKVYSSIIFVRKKGSSKPTIGRRKVKKAALKKREEKGAKKKYYGRVVVQDGQEFYDVEKWDNKNMASKRSNYSRFTHEVEEKVLQDLCKFVPYRKVEAYIEKMKVEIKKRPIIEIGRPRGVKGFEARPDSWVRGAIWTRDHFDPTVLQHLKPKLLHVIPDRIAKIKINGKYVAPTDVVCFDDPNLVPPEIIKCIDWNMMIEKSITGVTEEVMEAVAQQQQKLASFW